MTAPLTPTKPPALHVTQHRRSRGWRGWNRRALALALLLAPLARSWPERFAFADYPSDGQLLAPARPGDEADTGCPRNTWSWAKRQRATDYVGYYVGGGNPINAAWRPCATDGTWGWDYSGWRFPRRVELGWWQRPKPQGGTGRYEPDGPHLLHKLGEKH